MKKDNEFNLTYFLTKTLLNGFIQHYCYCCFDEYALLLLRRRSFDMLRANVKYKRLWGVVCVQETNWFH